MNDYEKGRRWGFAIFRNKVKVYGEYGIRQCDKASMICEKYLKDGRRKNKKLTKKEREFYKGAVDGFQEFYNKRILKIK